MGAVANRTILEKELLAHYCIIASLKFMWVQGANGQVTFSGLDFCKVTGHMATEMSSVNAGPWGQSQLAGELVGHL